jgi:hypothetical protein
MSTQINTAITPGSMTLVEAMRGGRAEKPQTQVVKPVPIKVGAFGPQGSGKSTSAALIAAAYSTLYCNRAPVMVVDPEAAWPFLKRRIFGTEGIELIVRPYRSFKSLHESIREAEKLGCCAWIADPITLHWNELMQTYQGSKGFVAIDQWGDIRRVWGDYVATFLNSPMTCIASGRLGNDFEDREEEDSRGNMRTKTVKVGTKFKAGGGESFGYEPHLLLEMSLERKAKKVRGQEREGEGRMVHRADVLKDRFWALNGLVIRWSDKAGYQKGGYRQVWDSLKPHFDEVQACLAQGVVGTDTSAELVNTAGDSEWYARQKRRDVLVAELHAAMELLWGGTAKEAKEMRLRVFEHIFGFRSKEAADQASLDVIERGVRILQAFERRAKKDASVLSGSKENLLANLDIDIREFAEGSAEAADLPF